ncbi:ATP-binding protein [Polyangium aurulentum]|nr:ATP-binding protein [Polyangium aurulentum]
MLAGRRAVEISAAGLHPLLFIGSPGLGKTMLCRRLPTVMPPLSREEALEVTSIHSVAGLLHTNDQLLTRRPLRAPHHTVSEAGLVGGGFPPRPGEASLAHHGVLFLDDMQEFKKKALTVLDGVLKEGQSVLCQRQIRVTFPARPLTVVGVLPCPCGFNGTKNRTCNCPPERIQKYRERLRGAVFDRMDMKAFLSGDEVTGPRARARPRCGRASSRPGWCSRSASSGSKSPSRSTADSASRTSSAWRSRTRRGCGRSSRRWSVSGSLPSCARRCCALHARLPTSTAAMPSGLPTVCQASIEVFPRLHAARGRTARSLFELCQRARPRRAFARYARRLRRPRRGLRALA